MKPMHRFLAALVLTAALVAPEGLGAQASMELPKEGDGPYVRHPEATEAIDQLKSPYCPGLMLEVCPSPGGAALRDTLETLAGQGMASEAIVDWVLARYGQEWRALPVRTGKGLVAWVVPFAALVAGGLVIVLVLRRMQRSRPPVPDRELSEEERAHLDEALRELQAEEEASL